MKIIPILGDYVDVFEIIFSYLTEKEYFCIINLIELHKMNKTKIIAAFAEKAGITKTDAARYFDTSLSSM